MTPPPELRRAGELALEVLLSQRLATLPVRVRELNLDRRVRFETLQRFCALTRMSMERLGAGTDCLRDGCVVIVRRPDGGRIWLVLYNERMRSPSRRSFTLAHELGHILMGHTEDGDVQEQEANHFAAELLIPRILAWESVRSLRAGEDAAAFLRDGYGVSRAVAESRLRSLRAAPDFSEREKDLLRRYGALLPRAGEPCVL